MVQDHHAPAAANVGHAHGSDLWFALHAVGWFFPIILLIVGYNIPEMRTSVFSWPPPEVAGSLFFYLFIELIFAVVWVLLDLIVITNDRTTAAQLKLNTFVSSTINNLLMFLAGGVVFLGTVEWWLVVPTLAQLIDDYIIGNRAIVNALQKPFGLGRAGS